MTPEEKAVIDAAMLLEHAVSTGDDPVPRDEDLRDAVRALIYSCPQCNAGGHTCSGDGNPISHTATDCGRHEECGARGMVGASGCNRRAGHEGRHGYADGSGEQDTKDESDDVPPLHPDTVITRDSSGTTTMKIERWQDEPKIWAPATLLHVLAGDHIRIGADETDVLRSSSGAWHANVVSSVLPSGKVWDKVTPWEHTELRLDVSINPGFREYPAETPCEILCTPERLAVLTLMTVFPGTKEIKP